MYFKAITRVNPITKQFEGYYRLVESYGNNTGRVYHRTILNIGFLEEEISPEQLNVIGRTLTDMYQQKPSIFPETDPIVNKWVSEFWRRIVQEKRLDLTLYTKDSRMVEADALHHSNVREIGSEWLCYNTWHQLNLDQVLMDNGFSESVIQFAQKIGY
jgi:hypothetical protein